MQPQATPSAHKRRNPQPIEVAANPDSLLNVETVSALIGAGRSRIYDLESKGLFPSAIRLGTRCTRWRAGDVTDWLKAQTPSAPTATKGKATRKPKAGAQAAGAAL